MKKIVRLTESDLMNVVQKVINEQEEKRIVRGINFGKHGVNKAKREGLTPYYFNFKVDGDYKLIEVTSYSDNLDRTQIFLLKPEEAEKTQRHIEIVNDLVQKKLEQIKLYKQFIPSVTAEKIMK